MDCPECDTLKKIYDDCFKDFTDSRMGKKEMSQESVNNCERAFEVSAVKVILLPK